MVWIRKGLNPCGVFKSNGVVYLTTNFLMNIDLNSEDEVEQLRASVDFLVDLCDTVSPVRGNLVTFLMS